MTPTTPQLERLALGDIAVLTDPALRERGITVAFTERTGGVSAVPYDSLNLAGHVGDDPAAVDTNRARLFDALGIPSLAARLVTAEQVHGEHIARVGEADTGSGALVSAGPALRPPVPATDALITSVPGVPLMLFFADCVPVVLVAEESGSIAVVHAGWRGALAGLPGKTVRELVSGEGAKADRIAAYVGPCIGGCCYEVDETLLSRFVSEFGSISAVETRLDLVAVVCEDLRRAGVSPDMLVRAGECTLDRVDRFFSYRAGATTGRHGALATITKVE